MVGEYDYFKVLIITKLLHKQTLNERLISLSCVLYFIHESLYVLPFDCYEIEIYMYVGLIILNIY